MKSSLSVFLEQKTIQVFIAERLNRARSSQDNSRVLSYRENHMSYLKVHDVFGKGAATIWIECLYLVNVKIPVRDFKKSSIKASLSQRENFGTLYIFELVVGKTPGITNIQFSLEHLILFIVAASRFHSLLN